MEIIYALVAGGILFGILWVGYWAVHIVLFIVVNAGNPELQRRPPTPRPRGEGGQRRGREERWFEH
ncbi:MAG TPA: hypothetical protein VJR25_13590 [Microbacterium sp.]|uniref:hypothetical protein n=1 Tax=Microbacterium sp. TaxID=51671 RepID=UPI002B483ED6|nr:hypothetical protein [Microbacterium sp.]HKT57795.1 hypothetical protein [Microbacterium sp.]